MPLAAFLLLMPLLLWLGSWQLERGQDKRELHEAFASAEGMLNGSDLSLEEINKAEIYRNIEFRGHYLNEHQFLLDNMTDGGRAGYHVLTPFDVHGTDWIIIVDRGWVPKNFADESLPDVGVNSDERLISGKLSPLPKPGLMLDGETPGGKPAGPWPRVVQFASTSELAEILAGDQVDREMAKSSRVAVPVVLLADDNANGYLRDWQPPGLSPERHFAYAFQWFALAATLFIIFIVVTVRSSNGGSRNGSEES